MVAPHARRQPALRLAPLRPGRPRRRRRERSEGRRLRVWGFAMGTTGTFNPESNAPNCARTRVSAPGTRTLTHTTSCSRDTLRSATAVSFRYSQQQTHTHATTQTSSPRIFISLAAAAYSPLAMPRQRCHVIISRIWPHPGNPPFGSARRGGTWRHPRRGAHPTTPARVCAHLLRVCVRQRVSARVRGVCVVCACARTCACTGVCVRRKRQGRGSVVCGDVK